MRQAFAALLLCAVAALLFAFVRTPTLEAKARPEANTASDRKASVAAFEDMVPVLHHPRCMNCHMPGDFPRQGDDSHPHIMDVKRGPDGHGVNGVRCSTCHQDHNLPGVHVPPGAPDWGLPPPATPMIWQGLNEAQLCHLLKDPQQNGHRTVQQIVEHMHTPLVLWGWHPGEGRTAIPYSQERFLQDVSTWETHGAACPGDHN